MRRATTYAEFKRKPDTEKRVLMEITAYDSATSAIQRKFYFSTIGGEVPGLSKYWHGALKSVPSLTYTSREIGGGLPLPAWSDSELMSEDGYDISEDRTGITILDLGTTWITRGHPVSVWYGGDDLPFSEYQLVFYGSCDDIKRKDSGAVLKLNGLVNQAYRYTVGSVKIDAATYPNAGLNTGKSKPVCIGYVWNAEPVCVDTTNDTYMIADTNPAFLAVYQNGVALTTPGQYVDNLDGTFRMTAPPSGKLTCAVFGRYSLLFWAGMITEILKDFAAIPAGQIDAAAVAAAIVDLPYRVGIFVKDETPVMEVISKLSQGIQAWWGFQKSGVFSMKKVVDPALSATDWKIGSEVSSESPIAFLDGSCSENSAGNPTWRCSAKYYENFSPTGADRLSVTLTPSQKLSFGLQWRDDYYENAGIKTKFPQAGNKDIFFRTYNSGYVISAVTGWVNLLGSQRILTRIQVKTMELGYNIGDIVELTYKTKLPDGSTWYRHGYNAKKFLIVGIGENYDTATTTIDLWG